MSFRPKSRLPVGSVPELMPDSTWNALVQRLSLSARESDVLKCMFTDERSTSISRKLCIAEATVHTYRERLFRKLGIRSCAQLIALAFAAYLELEADTSHGCEGTLHPDDPPVGASAPTVIG